MTTKARMQAGVHSFKPRWIDKNGRELAGGDTVRLEFSLIDKDTLKEVRRGVQLGNVHEVDGEIKIVGLLGEDLNGWLHNPGQPMADVEIVDSAQ